MTDTEQKRIEAVCKVAHVDDISDLSDGYHTFKQLYYQRMMLFAVIVKQNRDKAWKSLRHSDGELCFGGGWFIVGIDTPEGSYTYHYENKYFDLFDCEILDYGKHWDGHTEKDVIRLLSLGQEPSGDAIDRKLVCAFIAGLISDDREREKGLEYIRHMPPVSSQQKVGHWVYEGEGSGYKKWHCSNCKMLVRNPKKPWYKFCPDCGAKMIKMQESEERK